MESSDLTIVWRKPAPLSALGLAAAIAVVTLPTWSVLWTLLLGITTAPPLIDLIDHRLDLFEARNIVIAYFFLDFGLGIVNSVLLDQREYLSSAEFAGMLPVALACANLALLLFYAGYYAPLGPRLAAGIPRLPSAWRSNGVAVAVGAAAFAGIAAYLVLLQAQGGISGMLASEGQLGASQVGKYYLVLMAFRLSLLAALISFVWARTTGNPTYWTGAIGLIALTFVIGISLGSRGAPLRTVLACAVAAHYIPARRSLASASKALLAAAVVVILAIVLPLQTALRAGGYLPGVSAGFILEAAGERNAAQGTELFLKEFLSRFMAYEELERVLERTGRSVEPKVGATFLEAAYGLVPRAWWPDKPDGVPMIAGATFLDHAAAEQLAWFPTLTWPGELYWNFMWPGLIAGMIVTGILCRAAYVYFTLNLNVAGALIYIPALLLMQMFVSGGLGAGIVDAAVLCAPVLAANYLMNTLG
jgi:hypothetical protein